MTTLLSKLSDLSALSHLSNLRRKLVTVVAFAALVLTMGGTWMTATSASAAPVTATTATTSAPPEGSAPAKKSTHKDLSGKVNLNTASEEQLMLLPTVGPAKAERVVAWRKKNGGFKRTADLRHVKGFGYKTWKRLEPFLDIKGDTTLAAK
jgi:competence ComEA-like helix-hairpin-helix protein